MVIGRQPLRSRVREELLARMRAGDVKPGDGINEAQLAAELGVSRTPLREALITLESEGQIQSESGKGFRYVPLSAREFEELGPVISALESLAIRLTPVDDLIEIGGSLAVLAAEFSDENAEHSLVNTRDAAWHTLLVSRCPNSRLVDLIDSVRLAIHRYESLIVPDSALIPRHAAEHAEIARCLVAGDVEDAVAAVERNWLNGIRRLLANRDIRAFS